MRGSLILRLPFSLSRTHTGGRTFTYYKISPAWISMHGRRGLFADGVVVLIVDVPAAVMALVQILVLPSGGDGRESLLFACNAR